MNGKYDLDFFGLVYFRFLLFKTKQNLLPDRKLSPKRFRLHDIRECSKSETDLKWDKNIDNIDKKL